MSDASTPSLGPRFTKALGLAYELHAGQTRKGSGVPYFGHLPGVTSIVIETGSSEDEAIAALLHDAAEDQGGGETIERSARSSETTWPRSSSLQRQLR